MRSTVIAFGSAALLLVAPVQAQEKAAPEPGPVLKSAPPNSGLSGAAAGRKLNRNVRFEDVAQGEPVAPPPPAESDKVFAELARAQGRAARDAQRQMDFAVKEGRKTDATITREACREAARNDWDTAAEACRKTPGCVPTTRSDGELKTRKQLTYEHARRLGLSGAPKPD